MEEAVGERRKAFAAAHRSDEDRQAYIYAFRRASSVIVKAKTEAWQATCYPMLKHLHCSGMYFLHHIFNLSWSLHSFHLKDVCIIPIHKMGKPLDSPASIRPIFLTSCVSKLFEEIIPSRLLFFLESDSILSPRQAGFRPGTSTLNQILFLALSILDGFNKPNPGSRTILATIDFSFRLASLLALLVELGLSFLIGALAWFIKITKVVPFESVEVFRKDSFLALYFSLFFINDLPGSLPSSADCSLYADNLAI